HLQAHSAGQVGQLAQIAATVSRDQAFDGDGRGPDLVNAGAIVDPHWMEGTRGIGRKGAIVTGREAEVVERRGKRHNASTAARRVGAATAAAASPSTASAASSTAAGREPRLVPSPRRGLLGHLHARGPRLASIE